MPVPEDLTDDPSYRAAVIDLLGVLAYGELMAFERLAADVSLSPTIDDKTQLAAMADRSTGTSCGCAAASWSWELIRPRPWRRFARRSSSSTR